ncbi:MULTISPECIES: hypothetical protein [unclassified Paenibacillus]|nr:MULTISPECIES: hypothetical protein [unclassified Paenibacillus]
MAASSSAWDPHRGIGHRHAILIPNRHRHAIPVRIGVAAVFA